ncbi:MAG: MFS transporter, partial [Nocardioides sp.]
MTRVRGSEVWAVPGFRRYFLGRTISTFGSAFGILALTFAVLEATGSAADLGIVLGASAVPALLLMLIGGVVGDRLERRRILVSTDLVMGATQLAAAACFAFGFETIALIAGLQMVRGAASAFFNPASTGMLPTIVPASQVQSANAVLGMAGNVSGIVGPAAAGVVIATTSPATALVVDAGTYFVSALFLWSLPRSRGRVQAGMKVLDDVREGWREF